MWDWKFLQLRNWLHRAEKSKEFVDEAHLSCFRFELVDSDFEEESPGGDGCGSRSRR